MPRRHPFVTIEGLKGSGKTTISRLLAQQLSGHWYTTPPEPFRACRDSVQRNATPEARTLYYLAGIAQASAEIAGILAERPVVCDKFLPSVLAYSRAAGVDVATSCLGTVLVPDHSIVLVVPEELRRARIASRGPITPDQDAFLQLEIAHDVLGHYRRLHLHVLDNSAGDPLNTTLAILKLIDGSSTFSHP